MSTTSEAVIAPSNSEVSTSTDWMAAARECFCADGPVFFLLQRGAPDLLAAGDDLLVRSLAAVNGRSRARADQVRRLVFGGDGPVQLAVLHVDGVDRVEGLEDLLVSTETKCAQEDGPEELALAIDADVERVFLVVLELDPRTAVRDVLVQDVGASVGVSTV